jgi:hypothetical protein
VAFFVGILLVIFAFIYIGIVAFSIGGAFGSVINSLIPILGGIGASSEEKAERLNQNTEDKENFRQDMQIFYEKIKQITTS